MNIFLALFFVPAWLKCSVGSDAAINDLQLIHQMLLFKTIDNPIAEAAIKKLQKHCWYLVEETVVYALFSDNPTMTNEKKTFLARHLLSIPQPQQFRRGIPTGIKTITTNTALTDLMGPNSWFLIKSLGADHSWIQKEPNVWESYESYQALKNYVHTVKVVNDAAERGVKLNTDYATILTDNDEQRNSLLQAVEKHRHDLPDCKKSTLSC